jgi:hypothetical protein
MLASASNARVNALSSIRHGRESGSTRSQMEKSTARNVCCVHPEWMDMQHHWLVSTKKRLMVFRFYRQGLGSPLRLLLMLTSPSYRRW